MNGASVKKVINSRFSVVASKDNIHVINENFSLKMQGLFLATQQSVEDYIAAHDHRSLAPEIETIKTKKLANGLSDALDIGSMGMYQIAIFTVGRVIEQQVNDYLRALVKAKKLKSIKLSEVKLDAKIGILKKNKLIDDKLFHELTSIKISRNDTGHPLGRTYSRSEAIGSVNQAVLIVKAIEAKIKKLS